MRARKPFGLPEFGVQHSCHERHEVFVGGRGLPPPADNPTASEVEDDVRGCSPHQEPEDLIGDVS